jgi:cell division protein FtsQ
VSRTSAQRFAARVRRRRQKRAAVTGSAMALGLVLGWLLFGSTALAVQHIEVQGLDRVPEEAVRGAVQFELGHPMTMISPQAAARRVAALPLVSSVKVVRSWPSTLVVEVTEREPIAAVPVAASRFALTDRDGVVVETVARTPAGLPLLDVDVARAGAASLRAARQVYDDLPAALRPTVRRISAASPDAVGLVLSDGSTVNWGSADDGAGKVAALLAVHPRPLSHPAAIDVSAPDTPAVTTPQ